VIELWEKTSASMLKQQQFDAQRVTDQQSPRLSVNALGRGLFLFQRSQGIQMIIDAGSQVVAPQVAADRIGVSVSTLAAWRSRGLHLPFIRVGRLCKYQISDLEEFLNRRRVHVDGEQVNPHGSETE